MKEKLSSLLNDKWLEVGVLWSTAFKHLCGLEGSPALERDLWWNYLKEIGVVYPAIEVHFLGHESEYCFVDNPLGGVRKFGIPKELAMKALVLGYFPDSPSLERLRNFP